MTWTSFPFENADTDESQYTLLFRELVGTGVLDTYQTSVNTGALGVVGSGSALQVSISAGSAIVRGHMVTNDLPYSINVTANSSGVTRLDTVVLLLDPVANQITPVYKTGSTSLSQTDTNEYEFPLARVAVPSGATNLGTAVSDLRRFVDGRVGIWTAATQPGQPGYGTPRQGQIGFNVTTARWEQFNGSAWGDLIPAVTAVSNWTDQNGISHPLYVQTGTPAGLANAIWIKPTA